jgi:hypothetical protein
MKHSTGAAIRLAAAACTLIGIVVHGEGQGSSRSAPPPQGGRERFTAAAINMGTPGRMAAGTVEMVVNRWSPDADRDRLMNTLLEQGPERMLETLQKLPRVGYIRTPNSIGYDIHFARQLPLPDGGQRITLLTDRYITFWEAANQPRSINYPFTVVEMHINSDGLGEGKMSIATKITANKENKMIELENYATQPVLLNSVKREKE